MKVYPIAEIELDTLGLLTIYAMVGFSVASFFLSLSISLVVDGLTSPSTTPIGQVVLTYGPYVCGIIALGSFGFGLAMWKKRGTTLKKIKAQSRPRAVSTGGGSAGVGSTTYG